MKLEEVKKTQGMPINKNKNKNKINKNVFGPPPRSWFKLHLQQNIAAHFFFFITETKLQERMQEMS